LKIHVKGSWLEAQATYRFELVILEFAKLADAIELADKRHEVAPLHSIANVLVCFQPSFEPMMIRSSGFGCGGCGGCGCSRFLGLFPRTQ
jgi:hypothetical protein